MPDDHSESPSLRSQDPPDETQAETTSGVCLNCGRGFVGDYCPSCGQKREPLRQPVHHFIGESLHEYFGLDGRVWRSLKLLVEPGRLTQEYLAGRRVTHLRPLRLYLTASLLFFFLLALLDPIGGAIEREAAEADSSVVVREQLAVIDSTLAAMRLEREEQAGLVDSLQRAFEELRADSLTVSIHEETLPGEAEEALEEAGEGLEEMNDLSSRQRLRQLEWQRDLLTTWPPDSVIHSGDLGAAAERLFPTTSFNVDLPEWMSVSTSMNRFRTAGSEEEMRAAFVDLLRAAIAQLPTVMFLLLPVFALLLKLIYIRRGWYYTEHLVFALHTHAFAFLIFLLIAALSGLSGGAAWVRQISWVLFFAIPLYFYAAQKRVYGQGWLRTALKAMILGWLYVTLLVGLGVALAFVLAAVWG